MSKQKPEVGDVFRFDGCKEFTLHSRREQDDGWLVKGGYGGWVGDESFSAERCFTYSPAKFVRSAGEVEGKESKAPPPGVPSETPELCKFCGSTCEVITKVGDRPTSAACWKFKGSGSTVCNAGLRPSPVSAPAPEEWRGAAGLISLHDFTKTDEGDRTVARCGCGLALRGEKGGRLWSEWNGRGQFACSENRSASPPSSAAPVGRQGMEQAPSVTTGNCGRITLSGIPCDLQVGHKERECQVLPGSTLAARSYLTCENHNCGRRDATVAMRWCQCVDKDGNATAPELEASCAECYDDDEREWCEKTSDKALFKASWHERLKELKAKQPTEGYESLHATKGMWNVINLRSR